MPAMLVEPMAKKRPGVLTRITPEVLDAAKIAAAYRGLTLFEYVSEVVKAAADRDIEEGHDRRKLAKPRSK